MFIKKLSTEEGKKKSAENFYRVIGSIEREGVE